MRVVVHTPYRTEQDKQHRTAQDGKLTLMGIKESPKSPVAFGKHLVKPIQVTQQCGIVAIAVFGDHHAHLAHDSQQLR